MRRLIAILFPVFLAAAAMPAQTSIRVDAPNVVAADEQFNVTFILEGEDAPSDFQWSQGNDFQLVWGPQEGRSTSLQIINGKRTRSSQFTYTYILIPKGTGTFTLPQATAKVKGKEITSSPVSIEVVQGASSSGGGQSSPSGGRTSPDSVTGISDDDIFLRLTLDRTDVVVGEPITATLKLYQRVNIAGFEDARFPSFNGFWSQEVEAPTNIEFRRENYNNQIYNTAVLRKYVLIPQQTEDGWAYGIALLQRPVIGRTLSDDFQVGDVITAIDSTPVSWTYDIYAYDKTSFTLTIEREGMKLEREIEDGVLPFASS